ncbi:MAG: phosphatidylserine/phosphatidylglycerophosphate/cardiolipin synthase family protein [Candidatus Sericytochromatia bacterium]
MPTLFRWASLWIVCCGFGPISAANALAKCPTSSGHLQLKVTAAPHSGGLSAWKKWQATGQFQSQWPLPVLKALLDQVKARPEDNIQWGELHFDPLERSYTLNLRAQQWPLWDHFQIRFSSPHPQQFKLSLHDNWFPDGQILERLQTTLQEAVSPLQLNFVQQQNSLLIQWPVQNLSLQAHPALSLTLPQLAFQTQISTEGTLQLAMKTAPTTTGTDLATLAQAEIASCLTPQQKLLGAFALNSHLEIRPADLAQIQIGQEKLSDRFQAAGKIDLAIKGQFKGQLAPFKLAAKGQSELNLPEFQAEGQHYHQVQSVPFLWTYSSPFDFSIWPELPSPGAYQPQTSPNQLTLLINGPAYFSEMKQVIATAKLSVDQEIFVFYDGQTTGELARLYLLKAMGLRDDQGQLSSDPHAPQGIRVFLLHNHDLNQRGADKVEAIFAKVQAALIRQITASPHLPLALKQYQERLKAHFEISPLTRGIAKSDHRKLLVIDGETAYTGGLNLADSYLTQDSYHDLMIRVQGPAVVQMHQLFKDNWQDLHPGQKWREDRLSAKPKQLAGPLSQIEVLTTDDQSLQIEAALLHLIQTAKQTIRLEHAYIYHEPIEKALREALARGVELELIVSERNDESVFEMLNPAVLLKLLQIGKADQVKVWLYQGQGGENDFMSHTKFLSVDGQFALVGSANLVPRSLHSPFRSAEGPLLFNEELSLYIADPRFVQALDQQLFERDKNERCRAVNGKDLAQLIEARGGPKQLLLEKLKGLLS